MEELGYDKKLDWSLLPLVLLEGAIRVMMKGHQKQGRYPLSWLSGKRGYTYSQVFNSMIRHINKIWYEKEDIDPETGELHADHLLCNAIMLIGMIKWGRIEDDRLKFLTKEYHNDNNGN